MHVCVNAEPARVEFRDAIDSGLKPYASHVHQLDPRVEFRDAIDSGLKRPASCRVPAIILRVEFRDAIDSGLKPGQLVTTPMSSASR